MKKIYFNTPSTSDRESRIGGNALIGGIIEWPTLSENEEPLTLVASIEACSIFNNQPPFKYISIFSYYSADDYFLDRVCYHGDPDELRDILGGTTKVVLHDEGLPINKGYNIPAMKMDVDTNDSGLFQGSGVGATPSMLQNEHLNLSDFEFKMQIYSSDFPKPFDDIFGLSDAIGYLYIKNDLSSGLFFVQTT